MVSAALMSFFFPIIAPNTLCIADFLIFAPVCSDEANMIKSRVT